jgi:hypothetical protein
MLRLTLKKYLIPFCWYVLFTVVIPVANQLLRGNDLKGMEHFLFIALVPWVLIGSVLGMRYGLRKLGAAISCYIYSLN